MMASGSEGDRSCFTCGYIRYATDPASFLIEAKRGRPAHGGKSLA
jgi:hypothetical protein